VSGDLLMDRLPRRGGRGFGTVVHVGAGDGSTLDAYRQLPVHRLVLAEADPEAAAALQIRFAGRPEAELHRVVLAPEAGACTWHRFNVRRFNGIVPPSPALLGFYPGLRARDGLPVTASGFAAWLQGLDIDPATAKSNLLVLDLPGLEAALLQALPPKALDPFAWLLLRGAAAVLQPPGGDVAAALDWLDQRGYREGGDSGDAASDPLWPVHVLKIDPLSRRNARLTQALAREREQAARQQGVLRELQEQVAAHSKALERIQVDHDAHAQRAAECEGRLAATKRSHAEAIAEHESQLKQRQEQLQRLNRDLVEARQTASHAVKLNALRESDLRELQSRYEELLDERQRQHELLAQLAQLLRVAATSAETQVAGPGDAT
jgi:hypothetical protein